MLTDTTAIRTYFSKLGLEREIADIYLALHAYGPQTLSELSRNAKVERTRIYRLIDRLMESNLVEVETHYKRGVLKAAPIANLHILIAQKEHELKSLQDELELIEQVLARNSLSSPATRVQFYQGPEGYKQMMWNEVKAKTEVLGLIQQIEQPRTNKAFFERWVEECNKNSVHYREIHGEAFRKSYKDWYATHDNVRLAHYEARYAPSSLFTFTHSMTIYDNIVAYFNWKDDEIFGIEIHNKDIANAQRTFFEMLWAQAQPEGRAERHSLIDTSRQKAT